MSFGLSTGAGPFTAAAERLYPIVEQFRKVNPLVDLSKVDDNTTMGFPGMHNLTALPAGGFLGYAIPRINTTEGLISAGLGLGLSAVSLLSSTSPDNLATTLAFWTTTFAIGATYSAATLSGRVKTN